MVTKELEMKIAEACKGYEGPSDTLRGAIGTAFMCKNYGWRTMKLIHAARAWKKYKEVLRIDFEEEFPEETELANKLMAYRIWKATGRFWDVMLNKTVIPKDRRFIYKEAK